MKVGTYTGNRRVAIDHRPRLLAGYRVRPRAEQRATRARAQEQRRGRRRTPSRSMAPCGPPTTSPHLERMASPSATTTASTRPARLYHYVAWNEIPGKDRRWHLHRERHRQPEHHGRGVSAGLRDGADEPRPALAAGGALDGDGAIDRHLAVLQRRRPTRPTRFNGFSQTVSRSAPLPEVNGNGSDFSLRRLGACGANRGPHGHDERPPNGERRRPRVAHRGTKSTTWASTSTAGPKTAASASPPA